MSFLFDVDLFAEWNDANVVAAVAEAAYLFYLVMYLISRMYFRILSHSINIWIQEFYKKRSAINYYVLNFSTMVLAFSVCFCTCVCVRVSVCIFVRCTFFDMSCRVVVVRFGDIDGASKIVPNTFILFRSGFIVHVRGWIKFKINKWKSCREHRVRWKKNKIKRAHILNEYEMVDDFFSRLNAITAAINHVFISTIRFGGISNKNESKQI